MHSSLVANRPRPNVTNHFHTRVECVIVNKKMTTDVHEYFDEDHDRAFIEQIEMGIPYDALYSYKTNEFITWFPGDSCKYTST